MQYYNEVRTHLSLNKDARYRAPSIAPGNSLSPNPGRILINMSESNLRQAQVTQDDRSKRTEAPTGLELVRGAETPADFFLYSSYQLIRHSCSGRVNQVDVKNRRTTIGATEARFGSKDDFN